MHGFCQSVSELKDPRKMVKEVRRVVDKAVDCCDDPEREFPIVYLLFVPVQFSSCSPLLANSLLSTSLLTVTGWPLLVLIVMITN